MLTNKSFYLLFFIPLLIVVIILLFLKVLFISILFFCVAYTWHMALVTPGMREKVYSKAYRFSFLRVIFQWHDAGEKIFNTRDRKRVTLLLRTSSPFIFTFAVRLVAGSGNLLFSLLASLLFETIYFFSPYRLHDQTKKEPTETAS